MSPICKMKEDHLVILDHTVTTDTFICITWKWRFNKSVIISDYPSDMCSPNWGMHILNDKCSPTWEKHIPSDMCSPT